MDKIKKLLANIPVFDRISILAVLEKILLRNFTGLQKQKLKGYECIYRVRIGKYRIIFYDDSKQIIIKGIKKRNEKTYKL